MSKNERIKMIIMIFVLSLISFAIIIINGSNYELKTKINNVKDINDIKINIDSDNNAVKLTDKKYKDGILSLKFKSLRKGLAIVEISYKNHYSSDVLFVHHLGVITLNRKLGRCTLDIVAPISILIIIIQFLIIEIKHFYKNVKNNLYQYKNITFLGFIIFLSFMFINQLIQIINYKGLFASVMLIIRSVDNFSNNFLPIFEIILVLVTLSNVVLLKKEGFTWRNMLGVIFGLAFILSTLFPDFLYDFLLMHFDDNNFIYYLYKFIELFIYAVVSYLECIFFATIVLAFKATRRVPKFDKDYIIILGCKIKDDGTLTTILKSRTDRAIEFSRMQREANGKKIVFIPSGGKGNDEVISEAEAIKNYLMSQGIDKKDIILEDKAKNTYENIKNSYKLIKENDNINIAFSTTNYHVFRAGIIATKQNILVEGIGSRTKSYFWINAFVREFIGTLYSEKKSILRVVVTLAIIFAMIVLSIVIFYPLL
ncbi:MAG: YdcF family protein [Bacilli bacterium]|nr:YdcF family protein [Bacilli bacterium]